MLIIKNLLDGTRYAIKMKIRGDSMVLGTFSRHSIASNGKAGEHKWHKILKSVSIERLIIYIFV
jgi:hypothetical protein